jgi:hypothetical protein
VGELDNCVRSRSVATMCEFASILGRQACLLSLPVSSLVQKPTPSTGVLRTNGTPRRHFWLLPFRQLLSGYWNSEEDYRVSWL